MIRTGLLVSGLLGALIFNTILSNIFNSVMACIWIFLLVDSLAVVDVFGVRIVNIAIFVVEDDFGDLSSGAPEMWLQERAPSGCRLDWGHVFQLVHGELLLRGGGACLLIYW